MKHITILTIILNFWLWMPVVFSQVPEIKIIRQIKEISCKNLCLSPDGEHIAYIRSSGESPVLILDGKELMPDFKDGVFIFSPDSKKLVCIYKQDKKWVVTTINLVTNKSLKIDAQEIPESDKIDTLTEPVFSPDSRNLAYIVGRSDGELIMVNNKTVSPGFYRIRQMVFSPNSDKLAYSVRDEDRKWSIWLNEKGNDKEIATGFTKIDKLLFAPNNREIIYSAEKDKKWAVMSNNKKISDDFDDIGLITFSPNGKKLAYTVCEKGKVYIIVDDEKEFGDFESVVSMVFTADSRSLIYEITNATNIANVGFMMQNCLMMDKKKMSPYVSLTENLTVSSDGSKVVYLTTNLNFKTIMVMNTNTSQAMDLCLYYRRIAGGKFVFDNQCYKTPCLFNLLFFSRERVVETGEIFFVGFNGEHVIHGTVLTAKRQ